MTKNQKPKRGSKKKLVVVLLLVVIILGAGATAAWWLWLRQPSGELPDTPWNPTVQDYKNAQNEYIEEQKAAMEKQDATPVEKQQAEVSLAEGYGYSGDYNKAVAIYDKILNDASYSLRYDQYMVMGKFYALSGDQTKAKQAFAKAEEAAKKTTDAQERQDELDDIATYRQEFLK